MSWSVIGEWLLGVLVVGSIAGAIVYIVQVGVKAGMADTLNELKNTNATLNRIENILKRVERSN